MKEYTLGLIQCNCSKRMKSGKLVQVYDFTYHKRCPNCRKRLPVQRMDEKTSKLIKDAKNGTNKISKV